MENGNVSTIEVQNQRRVKRNVAHRAILSAAKTPYRLMAEMNDVESDPLCFSPVNANWIIDEYEEYCRHKFYNKYRTYIPDALKKIEGLGLSEKDNRIERFEEYGKLASVVIEMMEEEQQPRLCVTKDAVNKACDLIEARTFSMLLNQFWEDIPEGKRLSLAADRLFEEICSQLKIPRRTRSIINAKAQN